MQNYESANLALQSMCPNNVIITDDHDLPSVMVKIPKMTCAQLGLGDSQQVHPAFIVDGREVEAIYISKYDNSIQDGCACSLPAMQPASKIGYYDAVAACTAKGKGWHLMTRAESALIAQMCARDGFLPMGNNMNGRDYRERYAKAIPTPDGHTAAGTGPLTWYHDQTIGGIADLNGNTSNWIGGIRLFCGELQLLPNNDAAWAGNSQEPASSSWKAVDGITGAYIDPDGKGTTVNSLKLDFNDRYAKKTCDCGWQWTTEMPVNCVDKKRGSAYSSTHCDDSVCGAARELLQALALLPVSENPNTYEHCKFWANNGGQDLRCHFGGSYHDGADAGVFFTRICDDPNHGTAGVGFRCAYIESQ